ncbi:MAG: type II toxin-antitoxin system VapC family toxin, partial [Candidatus Thiodiazotropha sp.]
GTNRLSKIESILVDLDVPKSFMRSKTRLQVIDEETQVYLSVVTVGGLRRGVELITLRGDVLQADTLEQWLQALLTKYEDSILDITPDIARLWGRLRVPHPENALDKLIGATALIYDLTVVTRNHRDFEETGVPLLNPFEG